MANATDAQVQKYSDVQVRPFSEQVVALVVAAQSHKSQIDDVYAALSQESPTWTDTRTDSPPHLAVPSDLLAWNAFVTDFITFATGHGNWPIVQKLCTQQITLND